MSELEKTEPIEPTALNTKCETQSFWKKKKKTILSISLAILTAINCAFLYKNKDLINSVVQTTKFRYALSGQKPPYLEERETEKEMLDSLGEFEASKKLLMIGEVCEFDTYTKVVSSLQQDLFITILSAGKEKYKSFSFMTPGDDNKEFTITGKATLENIVCESRIFAPRIFFEPEVSDIFSPNSTIEEILVFGKKVPSQLIHQTHSDVKVNTDELPSYYLDCAELLSNAIITKKQLENAKIEIEYRAKIDTQKYDALSFDQIGTMQDLAKHPNYYHLIDTKKNITISRYPASDKFVSHAAKILKKGKKNPLEIARACYDYTQRVLYYNIDSKVPSVSEIMVRGDGKCVDYSNLMISLLLACGIPAKEPQFLGVASKEGRLIGLHAWVEFMVPLKNGKYQWILSDPTWGDNPLEENKYFQCTDKNEKIKHAYQSGFNVFVEHAKYLLTQKQHWQIKDKNK